MRGAKRRLERLEAFAGKSDKYVSYADPRSTLEIYRDLDLELLAGEGEGFEIHAYCVRNLDPGEAEGVLAEWRAEAAERLGRLENLPRERWHEVYAQYIGEGGFLEEAKDEHAQAH